jgi:hypothetical protein
MGDAEATMIKKTALSELKTVTRWFPGCVVY